MRLPADDDKSSPELRAAIKAYNDKRDSLDQLRTIKNVPIDSIKFTLTELALKLANIYTCSQNGEWLNKNADAYERERSLLHNTWEDMCQELIVLGGVTIPSLVQPINPLGKLTPPIGPIIDLDDKNPHEITGRVVLGILGAGLLIAGLGNLAMAGFKLAGVHAAVESAKKAADLAARKAAEEAVKKLIVESVSFAVVGGVGITEGVTKIAKAAKKNEGVRTISESLVLPKLEPPSEVVIPPINNTTLSSFPIHFTERTEIVSGVLGVNRRNF